MKKVLMSLLAVFVIVASFSACGGAKQKEGLTIGLIQLVEHTSLNEIRESFELEITTLAAEKNLDISIQYKNAQGDASLVQSISREFVSAGVDVIVAIATPSAQGAAAVTSDIPIVFSAVTDPVAAGLLTNPEAPEGNITGVSDAIAVDKIFDLASELTPNVTRYGLIYNNGEINSVSVIEQVKAHLTASGMPFSEIAVSNSGEVLQSTKVLLEDCDGLFVPIDNTVARVMGTVAQEAIDAKVPVYTAADSLVIDGGLATVGVNYTQLGKQTAVMAVSVLEGTPIKELPVQVMDEVSPFVNEETAAAIGVDVSKYIK